MEWRGHILSHPIPSQIGDRDLGDIGKLNRPSQEMYCLLSYCVYPSLHCVAGHASGSLPFQQFSEYDAAIRYVGCGCLISDLG